MNEQNKQISIIDQFIYAISKIKAYPLLVKQSMGEVFKFVVIISILITGISFVIPVIGYHISLGGLQNFFQERLPRFTIENGELTMDGKLDMDLFGVGIKVDPNVEKYTEKDLDENSLGEILISKTNIIISNVMIVNEIPFDGLNGSKITNDSFVDLIPYIYGAEVFLVFMMILSQIVVYLAGAAGYILIAFVFLPLKSEVRLTATDLFKIGVYCKTLSALLTAINSTLGYVVGYDLWYTLSIIISWVYFFKGIMAHNEKNKMSPTQFQ